MFIINRILWILNILAGLLLLVSYVAPYTDPMAWWVIAFFGLSFPVLFITNLLFVIFWLIQGKLKVVFSVACLLLGFSHFSKIYKFSGEKLPGDEPHVNLMSMNVKGFGFGQNESFLDSVVNYLVENKMDVVCFQEFWNRKLPGGQDVSTYVRKKGGFVSQQFNGINGRADGHGTMLFSRFPIVASGKIKFEENAMNGAVWADIKFPGNKIVRVYSVHLQSNQLSRKEQLSVSDIDDQDVAVRKSKSIVKRLKYGFERRSDQVDLLLEHMKKCKYPIILAGDLNDTQLSYCYRKLRQDKKDAFVESGEGIGNTYVGPFPSYRIDYIFFDGAIKGYDYFSGPNFGSDHKLIKTKLIFPEEDDS